MKSNPTSDPGSPITRRSFLKTGAVIAAGVAALPAAARAQVNKNSKLRIFQIGVGGIGDMQRKALKGHPMVEFAGFCDVDRRQLDKIVKWYPEAWTLTDYREAFANRLEQFDAVIIDTPDFHHAPMMLTAMKHHKHIYGQKPLVQQLDELRLMRDGLAARPRLVTQMGNQRACREGRMQAVEMLRRNQLGRPVEAWAWTGGRPGAGKSDGAWKEYPPAKPVPDGLDWNLWRGPLRAELPYSEALAPANWRDFWETGGGELADWGCHLLDVLYFAYDLPSPEAVLTHTIRAAGTGHSAHNESTLTFPGGGKFARGKFVVRYNDYGLLPSFAALGLPDTKPAGTNYTLVVCEEGALLLQADGKLTLFRKGRVVDNEPLPVVEPRHHWKDWADNCLGANKPLWTPFQIGWRITEPALLAIKATRFPGEELRWDGAACRFTNHDRANAEILSRQYRAGFEPPQVA